MNQQARELTYEGEGTTLPLPVQTRWKPEQQALIRSVAHQIRSTLASVTISAEALATDPESPPAKVRRHAEVIGEHAYHISRLLDDLVVLVGDQVEKHEDGVVELHEVVWEAARQLWQLAHHRSISLEIPSDAESRVVQGKRNYLVQAIRGCIEQGILNLPEESQISVQIEPQQAADTAGAVEVLFEYVGGVQQSQALPTSGRLGLDQVTMRAARRIVEAHGGDIAPLGGGRDGLRILLPRRRVIAAGQISVRQAAASHPDTQAGRVVA